MMYDRGEIVGFVSGGEIYLERSEVERLNADLEKGGLRLPSSLRVDRDPKVKPKSK